MPNLKNEQVVPLPSQSKESFFMRRTWAYLIYVLGMNFFAVSLLLFFGQLLHHFQPFFSIGLGIISLIWAINYWRRILILYRRKISVNRLNNLFMNASLSVSFLFTCITIPFLEDVRFYWPALGFFSAAMVLMFMGSLMVRTDIQRALSAEASESEQDGAESDEDLVDSAGLILGLASVGLIYLLFFIPLTIWIAESRGLNAIDIMLFVDFHGLSSWHGFRDTLAELIAPANTPFILSFGILYGSAAISFVLLRLSTRADQWGELVITANGLLMGYFLTIGMSYLLGITSTLIMVSEISFAYVFLIIYASRALKRVVPRWGIKYKYEYIIDGVAAVAIAWIISRIFGSLSVIFSGFIFYGCTFVAMTLLEFFGSKIKKWLFGDLSVDELVLDTDVKMTLKIGGKRFFSTMIAVFFVTGLFPLVIYGIIKLIASNY